MISSRQPIGLKASTPEGPISDPRRSYDRGAWAEGEGSSEGAEAGGRRATPAELATISTEMLRRELERRRRGVESLLARRDALRTEIAELDAQIRELSDEQPRAGRGRGRGAGHGGRRSARLAMPRPKNAMSLPDAIAVEVEVGDSITPAEAAKRVLASGYQTTAKTFTMVVANALSKDKRFKRLGRGKYERAS